MKRWLINAIRLALAAVVAVTVMGVAAPAEARDRGDHLDKGQSLYEGDRIFRWTVEGYVELVMQDDGNLVLYAYDNWYRRPCWASNTWNTDGRRATYQHDGNFVIYDSWDRPLWASNTVGSSGSTVDMNKWGQLWVGYTAISNYCFGP